jgi:hypothetical protein
LSGLAVGLPRFPKVNVERAGKAATQGRNQA